MHIARYKNPIGSASGWVSCYNKDMIRHRLQALSTSTPTQLTIDDEVQSANTLVVQNINDSGFIYIGTTAVSSSNYGYKIYPGQGFTIELSAYTRVYAVSSNGSMSAAVMVIERAI
jgi:hypothetical protein